jgi:hypothetical protein
MTTDNTTQTLGQAVYERQRELNELCEAIGLPLGTEHAQLVDVAIINRAEAAASQRLDGRLRELIMIWQHRAQNPGMGSQHYQHGVKTAWDDAICALQAAIDGE